MNGETLVLLGLREFYIALSVQFGALLILGLIFWGANRMTITERINAFLKAQSDTLAACNQELLDTQDREKNALAKVSTLQSEIDAANAKLDELGAPK